MIDHGNYHLCTVPSCCPEPLSFIFFKSSLSGQEVGSPILLVLWGQGEGRGVFASSHFCDLKNIILTLTEGFSGKNRP
jgi:hypothetical protein